MIDEELNDNNWLTSFPHHSNFLLWCMIHMWHASTLQKNMHLDSSWIIKNHPNYFTIMLLSTIYIPQEIFSTVSSKFVKHSTYTNMNATNYWPLAREYSVWNAAVAALQFWTADLDTHILSNTINQVFNAFFYSTSTHTLSTIWWNIIWSLHDHAKCHIWE